MFDTLSNLGVLLLHHDFYPKGWNFTILYEVVYSGDRGDFQSIWSLFNIKCVSILPFYRLES